MVTKLRAGKYLIPATIEREDEKIKLRFNYNKTLLADVKAMSGARWNPDGKYWTVDDNEHNHFQLKFLTGGNPYEKYDQPLKDIKTTRKLFKHQYEMVCHAMTRQYCIFACEMGTGKTLAAIEIMELSNLTDWWYVAPKSAIVSVELELIKWNAKCRPKFLTYEALVKIMREWPAGLPAPHGVIFDESSKIKSHNSQRSQAARALASGIRKDWGDDGYVILMSGTPAPKSPADWWNQCETACPGFLKEGTLKKFVERLAIQTKMEGTDGFAYNQIVGWRDGSNKCDICGNTKEKHDDQTGHEYTEAANEVHILHKRMEGLVLTKRKKDCLDLPQRINRIVKCKPTMEMMNAARLLKKICPRAVTALIKLRQLSDGFQSSEERFDVPCTRCNGNDLECHACQGRGVISDFKEVITPMETPKDQALLDLLDEHEEYKRVIVYAGFTESVDRVCRLVKDAGWDYIRLDGRGYTSTLGTSNAMDLNGIFQNLDDNRKIVWVAQPRSAGMGLTLTASPSCVYYSNDFDGEARSQSMARIDRPGSRGNNVIDLVCLPTDQKIIDKLAEKAKLEQITLGELYDEL